MAKSTKVTTYITGGQQYRRVTKSGHACQIPSLCASAAIDASLMVAWPLEAHKISTVYDMHCMRHWLCTYDVAALKARVHYPQEINFCRCHDV